MRTYKTVTQLLNQYQYKISADNANYIEFINNGDGIVTVDDVKILPFGSWAPVPPLADEENTTQYTIKFEAPATIYALMVTRKYYI